MAGTNAPTDKCLLHIPNKNVGAQLVAEMKKLLPEDTPIGTLRKLDSIGRNLDDNFDAIERWADRFYRECICDCSGGAEG